MDVPINCLASINQSRFGTSSFCLFILDSISRIFVLSLMALTNVASYGVFIPCLPSPYGLLIFLLVLPCLHIHFSITSLLPLLVCVPPCPHEEEVSGGNFWVNPRGRLGEPGVGGGGDRFSEERGPGVVVQNGGDEGSFGGGGSGSVIV